MDFLFSPRGSWSQAGSQQSACFFVKNSLEIRKNAALFRTAPLTRRTWWSRPAMVDRFSVIRIDIVSSNSRSICRTTSPWWFEDAAMSSVISASRTATWTPRFLRSWSSTIQKARLHTPIRRWRSSARRHSLVRFFGLPAVQGIFKIL